MAFDKNDVIDLYTRLEAEGITVWIDGGWGVDVLLGQQTCPHKDLDIAINQKDVPQFLAIITSQGYKETRRDGEYNIVMADDTGREIDYHVFITNSEGIITGGIPYPAESLTGTGSIGGQAVKCISAEYVVKFHSGYELQEKDFHDVLAICEKFGIELPEEYGRFIK